VTLDKVASESSVGGKGALEVEEVAGFQIAKGSDLECLGEDIEGRGGVVVLGHGETAAIDRHGISGGEFPGECHLKCQAGLLAAGLETYHATCFFD
jgi:hypothetical protein